MQRSELDKTRRGFKLAETKSTTIGPKRRILVKEQTGTDLLSETTTLSTDTSPYIRNLTSEFNSVPSDSSNPTVETSTSAIFLKKVLVQ